MMVQYIINWLLRYEDNVQPKFFDEKNHKYAMELTAKVWRTRPILVSKNKTNTTSEKQEQGVMCKNTTKTTMVPCLGLADLAITKLYPIEKGTSRMVITSECQGLSSNSLFSRNIRYVSRSNYFINEFLNTILQSNCLNSSALFHFLDLH